MDSNSDTNIDSNDNFDNEKEFIQYGGRAPDYDGKFKSTVASVYILEPTATEPDSRDKYVNPQNDVMKARTKKKILEIALEKVEVYKKAAVNIVSNPSIGFHTSSHNEKFTSDVDPEIKEYSEFEAELTGYKQLYNDKLDTVHELLSDAAAMPAKPAAKKNLQMEHDIKEADNVIKEIKIEQENRKCVIFKK